MSQEATNIVQSILNLGEERMGEVVNQLLANDTFVSVIQTTITSSLSAKQNVDRRLVDLLSAINVPSLEDLEAVTGKMDELEDLLSEVEDRLHRLREKVEQERSHDDEAKAAAPKKKAARKKAASKKS